MILKIFFLAPDADIGNVLAVSFTLGEDALLEIVGAGADESCADLKTFLLASFGIIMVGRTLQGYSIEGSRIVIEAHI
jgi:hypothetical protein